MKKISERIVKEFECFKADLKDTKGEVFDVKNPEHKRIVGNIVANEKAYLKRFGGVS
jgi:hypothetical protein